MTFLVKLLVIGTLTLGSTAVLNPPVSSQSGKKPYVRTGQEATISGSVSFTGDPPMAKTIDTSSDPVCQEANPKMQTEDILEVGGSLMNVVVFVVNPRLDDYAFEHPSSPATLEHNGCRYLPRVMAIRVGQTLRILNSDQTSHNTHPSPTINRQWNQSQGPGSPAIERAFDRPETAIKFRDNMHPWERAYVSVFSHPFYAITDASGNYKIEGLPPGTYFVVAWHESLGEKSVEVTVNAGASQSVDFVYSMPEAGRAP